MGKMHNPDTTRHARLFELLRQHEMARGTSQRLGVVERAQDRGADAKSFQTSAQQSLKVQQGHSVPPATRLGRKLKMKSNVNR